METSNWLIKDIPATQLKFEKISAEIAARIYTKRKQMGMTQKEFADYCGVLPRTVLNWESGTCDFSISRLINICDKLKLGFLPMLYDIEEK